MNRPGKSASSRSASARIAAGSQAQMLAMPGATTSRSLPLSSPRRTAKSSGRALPPPTQTELKPARSIASAAVSGASPTAAGGAIQIPTRPSLARSSSVVMIMDNRAEPLFSPDSGLTLRSGPAGHRPALAGQGGGEGRPGDRVVTGGELVPALGREPLEPPDLGRAVLEGDVDQAAGDLAVAAVDGAGGVEREHETAAVGQIDDEALVTGGVARGEHGGDPGRELDVAGREPPVEPRVVVVDPEHPVLLG